ncbi:MAG: STAS-like domain-containing protein [Bacteroidota bacterium]
MPTDSNVLEGRTVLLRVLDFTVTPGPRHRHEGDFSGEQFREEYVEPRYNEARAAGKRLLVDLDGTAGYASSFLEEAFGGLARLYPIDDVRATVRVKSDTRPWYVTEVMDEHIPEARD